MHISITRHPCYGNTGMNRSKIIRSIKDNFDAHIQLSSLTIVVNNAPVESCNVYTVAFILEYPDHIDLFDQHPMTMCRRPREIEVLEIIRAVTQMGLGHRLFYSVKQFIGQVFTASPDITIKAIKSREAKPILPHWREFLSYVQNSHVPYLQGNAQSNWDDIMMYYNSGINVVNQCSGDDFINGIDPDDIITTGYQDEEFNHYVFMRRKGRTAFICYVQAQEALKVFNTITGSHVIREIGNGLSPRFEMSRAQQLISLNNQHDTRILEGQSLDHYAERILYCINR